MASFIDKLKTQLGGYFAKEEDLATIATTGDYDDLINKPQSGGGGNDNIIEVVMSAIEMENILAQNSDLMNAVGSGNFGALKLYALQNSDSSLSLYPIGYIINDAEGVYATRIIFNNFCQYTGRVTLQCYLEYNNYFHSFQIGDSFDISPEQKTYYIGSLENSEEEPEPGSGSPER